MDSVLETSRVRLRRFTDDDAAELFASTTTREC